jgi:hypothetical protein
LGRGNTNTTCLYGFIYTKLIRTLRALDGIRTALRFGSFTFTFQAHLYHFRSSLSNLSTSTKPWDGKFTCISSHYGAHTLCASFIFPASPAPRFANSDAHHRTSCPCWVVRYRCKTTVGHVHTPRDGAKVSL